MNVNIRNSDIVEIQQISGGSNEVGLLKSSSLIPEGYGIKADKLFKADEWSNQSAFSTIYLKS